MKFKYFASLLVAVLLSHLLLVAECEKQKDEKRERGKDKSQANGKQKGVGKDEKSKTDSKNTDGKGQKSKGGKSATQGKFSTKDKAQCTWAVTGSDPVSLKVECKQSDNSLWCEFTGKPSSCSAFQTNQKNYWKQITRDLKKQKNICRDPSAVLKSAVCKKGPNEAHLKLTNSFLHANNPLESEPQNPKQDADPFISVTEENKASNNCTEEDNVDQKKMAEEYCGESWSSLCTFFITMLKNKNC